MVTENLNMVGGKREVIFYPEYTQLCIWEEKAMKKITGLDEIREKRRVDIMEATHVFYSLFFLEDYMPPRYKKAYKKIREKFETQFAQALHDYLVLCVAGEMRHSEDNTIGEEYVACPWNMESRSGAFIRALHYTPQTILECGKEAFCDLEWRGGFGGSAWCEIAKSALQYGKVPNSVFIDWVLHVRHNGNAMFDRDFIFLNEPTDFREFLDWRHTAQHHQWKELWMPLELFEVFYGPEDDGDSNWDVYDGKVTRAPFGIPSMTGVREFEPKITWMDMKDLLEYEAVVFGNQQCSLEVLLRESESENNENETMRRRRGERDE